jgi:outer membrane protein assembly factor BamE (lipoprotein component of BamABCDE complex)
MLGVFMKKFKTIIRTQEIKLLALLLFSALPIFTGCSSTTPVSDRNSTLTQGNVQMSIKTGVTTKAEVLETFGAPNVTTRDGNGQEVWSYQRQAQVAQSSTKEGYLTVIFAGIGSSSSGFETSSRMMTLIIKFDENDVVSDFNSRSSNF